MKYLIFLLSLAFILTDVKKEPVVSDIFKNIKVRIYKCIEKSEEASSKLKELASKNLESDDSHILSLKSLDLSNEDKQVVKTCRKNAFKRGSRPNNNGIFPIGIENVQFKHRIPIKESKPIRKLSMVGQIKRFGAFNIGGIFPCIENAQPAIKIIRDSINLIRSMDYTSAIINIYDNFSTISQGISYCVNTIFPA